MKMGSSDAKLATKPGRLRGPAKHGADAATATTRRDQVSLVFARPRAQNLVTGWGPTTNTARQNAGYVQAENPSA